MPSRASSETRIAALTAAAPRRFVGRPWVSSSSRLMAATAWGEVYHVLAHADSLGKAAIRRGDLVDEAPIVRLRGHDQLTGQKQLPRGRSPISRVRSYMTTAGTSPRNTSG